MSRNVVASLLYAVSHSAVTSQTSQTGRVFFTTHLAIPATSCKQPLEDKSCWTNTTHEGGGSMTPKYLHTMVRVEDLDTSIAFYELLGLKEIRRRDSEAGRYTLVFLAPPDQPECPIELTYNWDGDEGLPSDSRHFGHIAYAVANIYETCQTLMDAGVTINRPPRDGHMAFVRSPDNVSIELLQHGEPLAPAEPWSSMANSGHW